MLTLPDKNEIQSRLAPVINLESPLKRFGRDLLLTVWELHGLLGYKIGGCLLSDRKA